MISPILKEPLKEIGFLKVHAVSYKEVLDYLRVKHLLHITTIVDCTVNEILGYEGVIHKLMVPSNPYIKITADTVDENFSHDAMLDKTILQAIELVKTQNNEKIL